MNRHSKDTPYLAVVALLCGACVGTTPAAETNVSCGGEDRPQLSCESEFAYDAANYKGGFKVAGFGGLDAASEVVALRQIDQATERYVAQARRLCDEYNKCVLDKETYAIRSENLRRRMGEAPALYDAIANAKDVSTKRANLARAYQQLVPEADRTELRMDFSVQARLPGQPNPSPAQQGATLPSGTRVHVQLRLSNPGYVYLFQKSASGELNVLFPDARIAIKNPIGADQLLRIPEGGASFQLDDKDLGREEIFIVASLKPIEELTAALASLSAGSKSPPTLSRLTQIDSVPNCTRALSLQPDQVADCARSRGLSLAPDPGAQGAAESVSVSTEAADDTIAHVFSFEHVK